MFFFKRFPLYQVLSFFFIPVTIVFAQEAGQEQFEKRVIAKGTSDPWEIVYGPDQHLWVNESKDYRVLRIDPATGKKDVLLDLSKEKTFSNLKI